jgi:5'-AMP-activated protein kinase catalytic alpha subunit
MPSKLGKYKLLRTLGKGAFSKVKLALNVEDGQHYAIKLHRADDPTFDRSTVDLVTNEVKAIKKL